MNLNAAFVLLCWIRIKKYDPSMEILSAGEDIILSILNANYILLSFMNNEKNPNLKILRECIYHENKGKRK